MKDYTTVLLGITAMIGLIGLSTTPAFADGIHNTSDNSTVTIETPVTGRLVSGRIANEFESNPRMTLDYAKKYFHADGRARRKSNLGEQWSLFIQGNRVNL